MAAERARVASLPMSGPGADCIVLKNLRRVYQPQVPATASPPPPSPPPSPPLPGPDQQALMLPHSQVP